ncbi:MAG: hypothetical protein DSY42_05845 [Aquifex sp.]|nr:MAG: hypothetical protein DSY42_05845 [Aquifex sp.]
MRAVVWTDVLQTLLMLAGPLLIVVLCVIEVGGAGQVWAIAQNGSRISFK